MGMSTDIKVMKVQQLDQALYVWFREWKVFLSAGQCCARAGRGDSVGEKLSADKVGADSFMISFYQGKKFSLDQILKQACT